MMKTLIRNVCLLVLIGGSLNALSPRLWFGDTAADSRRDAERHRQQQEDIRRDEDRRRIRQEEESRQDRRLNPGLLLTNSF